MGTNYENSRINPSGQGPALDQSDIRTLETGTWYCAPGDIGHPSLFPDLQTWRTDSWKEDGLCPNCLSLGQLPSKHWDSVNNFREIIVQHHRTFDTFLRSALQGCQLCCLLLQSWEQNCRLCQDPKRRWFAKLGFESAALDDCIQLKFRREKKILPYMDVRLDEIQIHILCGNMPPAMAGQLICYPMNANFQALPEACIPTMSDSNTGSKASISRMKAWLGNCTSSHPACARGGKLPPQLPTRVIDVGGKGSSSCCLVLGEDKRENYATLSHCWGDSSSRPLLTTDETLTMRQRGIKDEELPKTFLDAVQVCRELGIGYLWIDSLCIIQQQSSQEDWAEEAPRMGDVYGNSYLTIAAAAAANSTEGCFRERLGIILWPCSVVLFGQQCHVTRHPTKDEEHGHNPEDRHPGNPLNRRAWVLQEQVLSRRSLIFARNRLVWRCASMSTSEKYPLGVPHAPKLSADNNRLLHCIVNEIIAAVETGNSDMDKYTCWFRMVQAFTSRELTYEDDKLPAIAGIAQRFAESIKDSYHAGLWRGDMVIGLLWHSSNTCANTKRTARAPSWSWASVNCPVSYLDLLSAGADAMHLPISPLLDIINVLDPPTCAKHPFGLTSKACLQLSGTLLPVVKDEFEDSGLFLLEHGTRYAEDIDNFLPDHWNLDPSPESPWYCLPVCVRHDPYQKGIRGDASPYKASWEKSLVTGVDEFQRFNRVFCLVIQAVEKQQDTYSRVGSCIISRRKGTDIGRLCNRERRTVTVI
ncbi:HET-domain-containing protein [Lentithecium fluviatile CBS 122367]|uniref:HET-domain-containing protein n=1 Tax=Lentithecium fluviatile CBS 122367 TaxID=1168545 RepID=A0A6G1JKC0_9PLEO|nr:HET-domain-containing protein [Lentithecium fluviatile CBS 122367]